MPDLFSGSPAPGDINVPGFNTTAFLAKHTPAATDPIITSTIAYARTKLGVTLLGAPGYCFGGRYAFRFAAPAAGVDVAFAAHPSLLQAGEIAAVAGPVSIAAAEEDALFGVEARVAAEAGLKEAGGKYQVVVYSGTAHGFGVRVDLADEEQRWAKEQAFLQAVAWFDRFLVQAK
jgi:dienelactone hydrolase